MKNGLFSIEESKKIPKGKGSDYNMDNEEDNSGGVELPEENDTKDTTPDDSDYSMDDTTDTTGDEENTDTEDPNQDPNAAPDDSDYSMDDVNNDNPDDTTGDEENPDDTTDDPNAAPDDSDYSMDDTGGDTGENPDDTTDVPEDDTATGEENEIKQLEDEVFSDIDQSSKNIRDKELKKLFVEMYNNISSMLIKINLIQKNESNLEIVEFSVRKLMESRTSIYDYLIDSYKNKSYIENSLMYYEFIAVIEKIHNLIDKYMKKQDDSNN